jgi:hypothetical protein
MRTLALFLLALAINLAGAAPTQRCNLNFQTPADRVFAQLSGTNAWQEFENIEKVPVLVTDGGISAELWRRTDGIISVRTVEPGEDFWIYSKYCFTRNGRLDRIAFELRTAWGWGYRLEAAIENGAIRAPSSGFFDTATSKSIPRPEQADDIAEALRPRLYIQTMQLPFSNLIARRSQSVHSLATH